MLLFRHPFVSIAYAALETRHASIDDDPQAAHNEKSARTMAAARATPSKRKGSMTGLASPVKRQRTNQDQPLLPSGVRTADIGIIVVLKSEYQGVRLAFEKINQNSKEESDTAGTQDGSEGSFVWPDPDDPPSGGSADTHVYFRLVCRGLKVVVCLADEQGQHQMSPAVERLTKHYSVRVLVLLGVSGALSTDLNVGDVVVADAVDWYTHRGAYVDADGAPLLRFGGRPTVPTDCLLQRVRQFDIRHETAYLQWQNMCAEESEPALKPLLHVGQVASGETVVKSNQFKTKLKDERGRHLLAVDTESGGFMEAVKQRQRDQGQQHLQCFVIRGISDMADDTKATEEKKLNVKRDEFGQFRAPNQALAAYNATLLLCAFIEAGFFGHEVLLGEAYLFRKEEVEMAKNAMKDVSKQVKAYLQCKLDARSAIAPASEFLPCPGGGAVVLSRTRKSKDKPPPSEWKECALSVLSRDEISKVEQAVKEMLGKQEPKEEDDLKFEAFFDAEDGAQEQHAGGNDADGDGDDEGDT